MKRIIPVLLTIVLILIQFNVKKVNATVVIPADDSTHYYILNHFETENWTEADFLTVENYDLYYDKLSGNEKTNINNKYVTKTSDHSIDAMINDLLYPDYIVSAYYTITGVYFTPILVNNQPVPFEQCKSMIAYINNGSSSYWAMYLFYCPNGDDLIISGNTVYCDSEFMFTYTPFGFAVDNSNDIPHNQYAVGTIEKLNSSYNSTEQLYYTTLSTYAFRGTLFCTMPYLFTSNTLTGIDTDLNSYKSYLNNVSYAIDRRTDNFINKINGGSDNSEQIIQRGFDPELFDGTLGFNWFNSSGSTNYVQSLDQFKPFIQLKYKINNYTNIHKNDVSLIWDSELNMKLTYRDSSNVTFITSCKYSASGDWDLVGHEDQFTLLVAQESNLYSLKSVRSTSGSNPYGYEFKSTNNINQNISFGISSYRHNSSVVTNSESDAYDLIKDFFSGNKGNRTLDSYGIIYFNVYLKDNTTGETSIIYKSAFDLFNNKFDDNHNDLVNNDDSAYNDFVDSFNYLDDNGDLSLVDYAKPYGYGGSSSQVGDITIYQNPYPYLLVDVPEGDWMNKTPRLTTILTDFKDALSEVKNDSILNVMSETYNYLPAPVWQYFTYAVGILIAIGIWRAITRR